MEKHLQELIDQIKVEGVKSAEAEAERIRKEAEKRADEIVARAHKSASDIVGRAKSEAERFQQTAREAVQQAGRNTILGLKGKITAMFQALIEAETRKVLVGKVLEQAILTLIKGWSREQVANLEVLVAPEELQSLGETLRSALAEELKKGLEIKPFPGLKAGFRVGMKDGSAYYNFTAEGIAEILGEYLNPRLAELMQQAVEKES